MLPIDREFGILYILYFLLYSFILYKLISELKTSKFGLTILLIVSIALNTILYFDPENFKGGGSLVILFYSGVIFVLTFIAFMIYQFLTTRKRKTAHNIGLVTRRQ